MKSDEIKSKNPGLKNETIRVVAYKALVEKYGNNPLWHPKIRKKREETCRKRYNSLARRMDQKLQMGNDGQKRYQNPQGCKTYFPTPTHNKT